MAVCNFDESSSTHNIYPNLNAAPLNNQPQFRLNKINESKDYFVAEIKERELMGKRLSKYIASFDYFDKSLIVLSVTTGRISIASFAMLLEHLYEWWARVLVLHFRFLQELWKNCLKKQETRRKKHNGIMLARTKLNSIESKISEALINNWASHEDFMTIINEENKNIKN